MSAKYRYPGLGYFEATDNDIFFGRDKEIADLQALVLQEKATVLHSRTGLGKISLLLAGVLPEIRKNLSKDEQRKGTVNAYIIRFQTYRQGENVRLSDTVNASICKSENLEGLRTLNFYLPENDNHIWAHFKNHELAAKPGEKLLFVLIIDHLEEIFTYPESEIQWFKQFLAELLDEYAPRKIREFLEKEELEEDSIFDRNTFKILQKELPVKVVFSLPSDKYYLVNRFRDVLPNIIKNEYELGPMSERQAREAIDRPALLPQGITDQAVEVFKYKSPSFSFSEAAREEIISFLSARSGNDAETGNKFIDAYGLQIICSYCEREYILKRRQNSISINDVLSLDQIIKEYYLETINELGLDAEDQKMVYELFEQKLIYQEDQSRLVLYEKIILNECRIKKEILEKLKKTRLIKEEAYTLGGISFEISSKILVNPILQSKQDHAREPAKGIFENIITPQLQLLNEKIEKNPGDYTAFKQRGDYYYFERKYADAITDYKKAIELNAGDKELYNFIGIIYYEEGLFDEAIDYYNQAIRIDEKYHLAYTNIGLVYQVENNYDGAESYFNKAISAKPDYADAYNRLGWLYETKAAVENSDANLKTQYLEKAKEYYRLAISNDETYTNAIINLGNIYYGQGDYSTAKQYYEKVLSVQPYNVPAINNLGLVCWINGDRDGAEKRFTEALGIDPAFELSLSGMLRIFVERGDFEEAFTLMKRKQLFPEEILDSCEKIWKHYISEEDYERAITSCLKLVEASPENWGVYNSLGLTYYYQQNYKEALKVFESMKEKFPEVVNGYINSSLIFAHYGEWEKAFENCRIARKIEPENTTVARNLALWYKEKGDLSKAITEFENYEKYSAGIPADEKKNSQFDIGQLYLKLGEFDKAVTCLEKAIEFEPGSGAAYKSLAAAYERKNEFEAAFKNYYQALLKINQGEIQVEDYKALVRMFEEAGKTRKDLAGNLSSAELNYLGIAYEYNNDYSTAENMYKASNEKEPDYYYSNFNLGYLNELQRKFKEALSWYEVANRLDKENFDPLFRIACCYYELKMMDKSEEYFKKSGLIKKDDPNVLLGLGNIEVYRCNYTSASTFYRKSLGNNGEKKVIKNNLGAVSQSLGFLDLAVEYDCDAIQLDALYELPLVNLGIAYCDKREFGKAFENLDKALKLDEKDIYVHMNYGNLYRKLNAFEKAFVSFSRCRDLDPNDEDYLYNLGRYYFDLQQLDLANEQVKKALNTNPTHKSTMILAAKICQRNNLFDEGLNWLNQAMGLDTGDYFPKFHLAHFYFHFGKPEETRNLLEELSAIKFDDFNIITPGTNELYGDWFKEKVKADDAAAYYSKALQDDPRNERLIQKMIDFEKSRNGIVQTNNYQDHLNNVVSRRKVETRNWLK